jgi:hypothetical protein
MASLRRSLVFLVAGLFVWLGTSAPVLAAPEEDSEAGASGGGSFSTSGGSGAAESSGSGKSDTGGSGRGGGFQLPEFVYGGNSVSVLMPFQIGLTAFQPRARLALQYDRQLLKRHWIHIGVAALLDRGNFSTFKMDECGILAAGRCQRNTVAGMDIYAGYTHKFHIEKKPWLVPYLRAGASGGFWKLPRVSGDRATREQDRVSSWYLDLRLGAGLRIFLLRDLAVGLDLNINPGFVRHKIDEEGSEADEFEHATEFLLGLEIPLVLEYRF